MVCARRLTLLLFCLLVSLTGEAAARMAVGPVEAFQQAREVRDLADIRRVGELRVLINQSRNSSGEVKDQAIGVEYVRDCGGCEKRHPPHGVAKGRHAEAGVTHSLRRREGKDGSG